MYKQVSGSAAFRMVLVLILTGMFLVGSTLQTSASSFVFTTFELSNNPGIICPGSTSCTNPAAEPQIRADQDGNFYASSENGLGAGTEAWKSTDGGLHYTALASPNAISVTQATGVAPGGGDTDVAVAPAKNAAGQYNVYVASLSLANVDVSTSKDGGQTWALNPTGATIPVDDREWIAADGSSTVCISYHDIATSNIDVNCSFDAGTTFTQLGGAIDINHAFLINNNEIGNLVIDPSTHYIYQIFSGIDNASELTCSTCAFHDVWVAVSTDGGKSFADHLVFSNLDSTVSYGHQFVNLSVDQAGNLYSVFSDNHNVSYSFSITHGASWSAPVQVNQSPSSTAIEPWSVANASGHLDIVWYGTSFFDGTTPPDNYPATATWFVYVAQNLQATTQGSSFTQSAATPVVHSGGVCESGITCTGNRDLLDDFGIAVNPLTGLASIIYSDDQFSNDANNPPRSGCTSAQNNTSACDHTAIATQTSGPGI